VKGGEFGTVTGRPRRIGWLDLPMLRHAARVSGFTGVAVNHVDVLAGLDDLKVCTGYQLDGEEIDTVPTTTERWERCEPVFETLDTWESFDSAAVAEGATTRCRKRPASTWSSSPTRSTPRSTRSASVPTARRRSN